jgi:ubiquinone/menaquinone biosynthesis C-methylase UbiE
LQAIDGSEKMKEAYGSEVWQKFWFNAELERAEWSEAKSSIEGICKILAEHGITRGKVLDICCGAGRLSTWMGKKGFTTVGLDISSLYLEEAKKRACEEGVESKVKYLLGDMRNVDEVVELESPFNCVLNFRNSLGFWGDKADEMIFMKARRVSEKDGVLIIGECDHLGQLMLNFDKTRIYESENGMMISEASMDYFSNMFTAVFKYYTKESKVLKYRDSFKYQARIYSVSELSLLLQRAGWKVTEAYEDIKDLQPFTHKAIFKGSTSMTVVAEAI